MLLATIVIALAWSGIAWLFSLVFHLPAGMIIPAAILATGAISLVFLDFCGTPSWGSHPYRRAR